MTSKKMTKILTKIKSKAENIKIKKLFQTINKTIVVS